MAGEQMDGGGTAAEAGASAEVVTGGAEGGGAEFDMGSALANISDSLGFGEKSGSAEGAPTEAKTESAPAVPAEPTAAPTAPPATPPIGAPKTWKAEEAAVWAAMPKEAQAAVLRREEDMFQGIERYKATAQFGTTIQQILQPYEGIMKAHGIDPVQNIDALMGAHFRMATGTNQQKLELFQQLAKDYKVDLSGLGSADDPYAAPPNPEVESLRREIAELKSGQTSLQQQRYQEEQVKIQSTVEAFATDPKNVYFTEPGISDEMARLLRMDQKLGLADAYEKAVWTNPTTRAKEIARQDADKQTAAREASARQLAETQRATAANLKVHPKAGAATLPLGTMDDTLAETLASMKNR